MAERATFGAGCFWGVEEAFRQVDGVISTQVGYSGGHTAAPTYPDVCTGTTGHAEVVEATFDPARVTYERLLDVFWRCHDPTTRNRQGPDVGTQYRSVIMTHSSVQQEAAEKSLQAQNAVGRFRGPIVTEICEAALFHRAEEYHQQYIHKGGESSCSI
jgi:peptide-methionine (S)-S-oxide reductase